MSSCDIQWSCALGVMTAMELVQACRVLARYMAQMTRSAALCANSGHIATKPNADLEQGRRS